MRTDITRIMVQADTSIRTVIETVDKGGMEIALVVGPKRRLIGTVTDGDIRRAILRDLPMDSPISGVMCTTPISMPVGTQKEVILERMKREMIRQIPIYGPDRTLVGIELFRDFMKEGWRDNPVVIMAGGKGKRLRPMTNRVPKPLVRVGKRPIIETLVLQLKSCGLRRLFIAVRHMSHKFEEHFGDGSSHGVEITYLREESPLGTAGAIRLAEEQLNCPFIVLNGDILTTVNFDALLHCHEREGHDATISVRKYGFTLDYGVVSTNGAGVRGIEEKPTVDFLINAGIYVIDPCLIGLIPGGERMDMTTLINAAAGAGKSLGTFLIREYWIDVGKVEDLEKARQNYESHFGEATVARGSD